tara:strand:- start:32017 stop:32382 length:366 start_codon:yes stop_codon:yes gene_type:complete
MANDKRQARQKIHDHEPEAMLRNKLEIGLSNTRRKHVPMTHIERALWLTVNNLVEEIYATRTPQAILCTNVELYLSTSRLLRIVERDLLDPEAANQTGERTLAATLAKRYKQHPPVSLDPE